MHLTKIKTYLQSLNGTLKEKGFSYSHSKDLQYGIKYLFTKENQNALVVIYYSKKKGFSFVYEGDNSFKFKNLLLGILNGENILDKENDENDFVNYVGCDESGKGDYFGPLVVGGFLYSPEINDDLFEIGIKDCKVLTDKRVLEIYSLLQEKYPLRIKSITLMPQEYNDLYEKYVRQNKKLNSLLGGLYSALISEFNKIVFKDKMTFDGYLIDRFADEKFIYNELIDKNVNIKTIIKGESDIAVAAGSIIARAEFLLGMKQLSEKNKIDIPFGSGANVLSFAKKISGNISREQMRGLVKLHFKLTEKIFI